MRKLLLSIGLLTSTLGFSQVTDCSQLFISEYVEGWGNNKAMEIYNPTSAPINLSGFFVARYSNGSTTATVANSVQLSGIVPAHGVFVAVLDKRDPNGVGQEAPIWDSLEVRGDGFFAPDYNVSSSFYWNGNDAIILAKGTLPTTATTLINATNVTGFQIVDVFGKIGENPANETGSASGNDGAWSTEFPYSSGLGVQTTSDHSMIRKATIKKGVTTNPSFFNPLLEYDTIPAVVVRLDANGDTLFGTSGNPILDGNWFSLGSHDCACNPASVDENFENALSVFPNPSNGIVNIRNNGNLRTIQLVNSLGQIVNTVTNIANKQLITLDLNDLRGVYFLKITSQNGEQQLRKVILK
ncbi:MAG: T9SS C-terminal target domain-containing protein [Flavobacteriales bacterium]|nr:T9SS C-terminal target domain-containing protein [Crocinitomicaceae bacterium]NBX79906.1 T9SS C-terminal target domain-containing protein [Flavobacteriales bacterium]NCA21436.1 T9SS C-terminal target domain-containing protein [Crocinitomicaceae bacterium]